MERVPEEPVVVGRLVAMGMVDVDVRHVDSEIVHQGPPAQIAGAHELRGAPADAVVLVVVVRDDRRGVAGERILVIRIEIAEMAPAVLVHALALPFE